MNHTQVIQHFIDEAIAESGTALYLEIGLGDLSNFNAIKGAIKHGVDPNFSIVGPSIDDPETMFFKLSSNDFFNDFNLDEQRRYDVIFIDGLHHAEQLKLDIENSLQVLNEGGVIIVHDINPTNEEMTLVPRQTKQWTGDIYKAWYAFNRRAQGAEIIMLAEDFGIGIIRPREDFKLTKVHVKNISYQEYKEWIKEQFTQL
jgi:2-polyprenyl-3-methyl-5-hydroxy-6-metoxy-1,4-benzoquinol methylase